MSFGVVMTFGSWPITVFNTVQPLLASYAYERIRPPDQRDYNTRLEEILRVEASAAAFFAIQPTELQL